MSEHSRALEAELARRSAERHEAEQVDADARELAAARELEAQQAARDEINRAIRGDATPTRDQPPDPPPPTTPAGSADGGAGDDGNPIYEDTPYGRMRVWDLDDNNDKETDK